MKPAVSVKSLYHWQRLLSRAALGASQNTEFTAREHTRTSKSVVFLATCVRVYTEKQHKCYESSLLMLLGNTCTPPLGPVRPKRVPWQTHTIKHLEKAKCI